MTQQKESGMQVHVWIGKSRIAGKGLFAGQGYPLNAGQFGVGHVR
jgi:hypothetical protein